MKIYSAVYNGFHPLDCFFPEATCEVVTKPEELNEPGFLIIHGGADISPSLYNREVDKRTYADSVPSRRDTIEFNLIKRAQELGITVFGICRGAQLMCAAAGGYLIQDVQNHSGYHKVNTPNGEVFQVNSIHHQMMAPWDVPHELLAWTKVPRSQVYWDANKQVNVPCEPEAVWYPGMGLAIQWHPEMMSENSPANKWVYSILKEKVNVCC